MARVHTIGHSTRSLDELVAALAAHRVVEVVDVRAWPVSKRQPHFDRASLERELPPRGLSYSWFGKELGGYRKRGRADSPHTALRSAMFRHYADHMESGAFRTAVDRLLDRAAARPVALMCAERHWSKCHRGFVADYLVALRGVEVIHILDAARAEPHRLHRTARVEQDRVIYDRRDEEDPGQIRLPGL